MSFLSADGTAISYKRLGQQKMKDVELTLPGGGSLKIGEQESDPIDLIKLGMALSTGVVPTE